MIRQFFLFITLLLAPSTLRAEGVAPLLDGWVRHQLAPFNNACPYYIQNGVTTRERCQVGCVATALESIISYHQRPIVLRTALKAWISPTFEVKDIPAGTRIDPSLILQDYGDGTAASVGMTEAEYARAVEEVAQLSLICGMAAHMDWGTAASGADIENLVEPLQKSFGWKTVTWVNSYDYTPSQWITMLKHELDEGRPILYTGYTNDIGGHAFVIDGYEGDRFHVNWGYGGAYDGNYYDLEDLNPFVGGDVAQGDDSCHGFFCNQIALFLGPDASDQSMAQQTLTRTGREVMVESVTVGTPVLAGKYTPITYRLRNTSRTPLTTTFEVFTNTPTTKTSDIFLKGDYGSLFGVTLQPNEVREVTTHCMFSQTGSRVLRISADDVNVLAFSNVSVSAGQPDNLVFEPVTVQFLSQGLDDEGILRFDATFSLDYTNCGTQRAGSLVTFGLFEGSEIYDGEPRHFAHVYADRGTTEPLSVTYHNLPAGEDYRFIVRWPWAIQQSHEFTVPSTTVNSTDELVLVPSAKPISDTPYYDLSGRRINRPAPGLLIHNGRKQLH